MPSRAKNANQQANSCYADGALSSVCLKTRLCTFYSKGGCPRDRFCKFAHGEEELQAAPDLTHTKMCPSLLKSGVCKRGAACRFAHREDELRPIVEVMPEPALAAALLAVWQQKSERWSDLSTDASDGAESVVSSPSSLGCEAQTSCDDVGEMLEGYTSQPRLFTTPPPELRVVDESFLDVLGHMEEGSQFWHAATGMRLTIRNTFFDIDDRSARPGATRRRCLSADARIGTSRSFV